MADPNSEVVPKAKRRRFSTRYKKSILEQAENCTESGAVERLLRREGLYSSHLTRWRQLDKAGKLNQPEPQNSGDKYTQELEAKVADLQSRLEKAETVIDVQKKLCNLLGLSQDQNSLS